MDFSSDDDLHICGKCKQGFSRLDEWLHHKRAKACVDARSGRRLKRGAGGTAQAVLSESHNRAAVAQQQEQGQHKVDDDEEDEDDEDEDDDDEDEASHNQAAGNVEQHGHGGGDDSSSCSGSKVNGRTHNGVTGGGRGGDRGGGDEDDDDDDDGDEDGEDGEDDDGASSSNGDSRGQATVDITTHGGPGDSRRSIITRNLFPIVPCIRKRERPGAVDAGCSSPGSGGYSPTGESAQPRSVKRKRGYPQRLGASGPAADISQQSAEVTAACAPGSVQPVTATPMLDSMRSVHGNGSGDSASAALLPPVYKCERCRKGFMKLSHLHRHMNKKNPCKPRMEGVYMGSGCQMVDVSPLTLNLSMAGAQLSSGSHLLTFQGPDGAGPVGFGDSLLTPRKPFCCSICHLDCGSYDAVVSHHSTQHLLFYPGYCRFCGRYCDKKNELLIHLSTHTSPDIVEEVAAEMKRVRQTKVERHGLTATAGGTLVTSGSGSNRPPASAVETSATCAVCSVFCQKETDVLVHHNGCHTPVGLCATLADLRRGRAGVDGGSNGSCSAAGAHSQWKNCFICCLKFTEGSEFEDHIIYHRTWISPHDHAVDVSSLQALSARDWPSAGGDGSLVPKGELRSVVTRSSCGVSGSQASGGSINGCSSEKGAGGSENGLLPWSAREPRPLVCWLCSKPFAQYEAWRWHLSGDHGLRPVYQCVHDPCRRVFEAWHELAAHSREHAQHAFICAVCNRHSSTHGALLTHAELHRGLGAPWFQPPPEPMPLGAATSLPLHAAESTGAAATGAAAAGAAAAYHALRSAAAATCAHCDQLLPEQQLQSDTHVEHCRRQYVPCLDCGEEVHRSKLVQHVAGGHQPATQQLHHQGGGGGSSDGSGSGDAKRFACDLCSSAFPVRERLTQHIKNVHGPRKYVCQVCGAAFKRSDKLKRHFSLHSDDRPYVCPHPSCGRGFKRADGLRAHARYHEPAMSAGGSAAAAAGQDDGSSPYACTHCDAAFESPTSYALHLRLDHQIVTALDGDGPVTAESVKREQQQHSASAY